MTLSASTLVDCRGQSCPAPILATAKAARTLRSQGGGVLQIAADDDAFPLDIQSWCRSSGVELVEMRTEGRVHQAFVRIAESPAARSSAGLPVSASDSATVRETVYEELDCRGQQCPQPILGVARKARGMPGGVLEVVADDPAFKLDIESWARSSGAAIESMTPEGAALRVRLRIAGGATAVASTAPSPAPMPASPAVATVSLIGVPVERRMAQLEEFARSAPGGQHVRIVCDDLSFSAPLVNWTTAQRHTLLSLDARGQLIVDVKLAGHSPTTALAVQSPAALVAPGDSNQCTLLVLHNDKEALLAALLVGVGAAAQGMDVMMFFTFWGLNLLRGDEPNADAPVEKVSWMQKMMKWMMPKGPKRQRLGQMDMAGLGRGMLGSIMKKHELMDVPELMGAAEEQGVQFVACTMSMQVMGITKRDLAPRSNLDYGGVAAFVESASRSKVSLTF